LFDKILYCIKSEVFIDKHYKSSSEGVVQGRKDDNREDGDDLEEKK